MSGPAAPAPLRARIESVDLLRGAIMILMALDHTRDYFGAAAVNPTDIATTTVPLFFTRWITHFCAPVFFLLTGTGAFLALRRRSVAGLSRFLLTRGLWLVFLELVLLRCLGWQFNFDYRLTVLSVLWALGWAMIVLSALVWLPPRVVGVIGAVLIIGHNLLDPLRPADFGSLAPLWTVLHSPGLLWTNGTHTVFAAYVLVPWVGVTAIGYSLGQIYRWEPGRRRRFLARMGVAVSVAFLALRFVNIYGDPSRWAAQRSGVFTALSFINTTKYPPSLLYLLMTLGPALLFLRAVDRGIPRALQPALVFGKVPMFYYLLHIVLIHLLAVAACLARYGSARWMFESPSIDRYPVTQPAGWPAPLPIIWLIWLLVVTLLYPLCRWYAGVKRRRSDWWLSYV
jgi:uncharacterized membrane protein